MALTIHNQREDLTVADKIKPGRRLCISEDGKSLVDPTDAKAARLYCNEHQEVDAADFKRYKKGYRDDKRSKSATEDKAAE